jgi:exopolysaccharide biosynthesis polyprenyl glycosylphosphotransferase
MIRFCNLYLPIRLAAIAVVDSVIILLVALAALRLTGNTAGAGAPIHYAMAAAASCGVLLCFFVFDLYDLDAVHRWRDALRQSLRAVGAVLAAPIVLALWIAPSSASLRALEVDTLALIAAVCGLRALSERVQRFAAPGDRVLLVGSDPIIQMIADVMRRRPSVPFRLRGVVMAEEGKAPADLLFAMCGQTGELASVVEATRAERVAVSAEAAASLRPSDLLDLRRKGARVEDAQALYESMTGRVPVNLLDPRRLCYGRSLAQGESMLAFSRFAGAVMAALLLIAISPLLGAIALAIELDSPGPVFYRQERVGLGGRTFPVLKFRSMRADAEKLSGPVWATQRDPRVTRVGAILRKLRLDELPQLWNVLRGEMAFIGPRPERPNFVAMLAKEIPFYDLRHTIRPGITGWAQVCAGYGATIDESREKLEFDLFYLKNRSLALNALVAVKTIKIMLCGKGAR